MILPLPPASLSFQTAPVRISVDAAKPTVEVPRSLFGVFFEEINQAGEGGVYGELLRNRGFASRVITESKLPEGWRLETSPPGVAVADVLSVEFPTESFGDAPGRSCLRVERRGGPVSVVNDGFWGIPLQKDARYTLTVWAKNDVPFNVALSNGTTASFPPTTDGKWRRYGASLRAMANDAKSSLRISPEKDGVLQIAHASLMPEKTWKGHSLRPDLAERVAALKPGFFRFPGGCYIEGNSLANAWDWKKTLGPPERRLGMSRIFWGYPSSDGLGFHEYLQFSEDLGAQALYVANVGLSHSDMATLGGTGQRSLDRYVQDALDAIEYANGPATSKWGAMRAKAGHPKPFGLKYIEIGNENGYVWSFGGRAAYAPRFRRMQDAIRAKYPDIVTIANQPIADERPQDYDLLSEHYYESPAWFWQNANRYDAYPRIGPKIYVGEYAVTKGSGRGNLAGALGEAAYMTGMERNADVVQMASYAPLLENVNARQWNPNAIVFDNHRSYGTPSYWVQALFAQNRIARVLATETVAPPMAPPVISGDIGFMTWNTQAEFKEIRPRPLSSTDRPLPPIPEPTGAWTFQDKVLAQTGPGENRQFFLKGTHLHGVPQITLSLKARKLGGAEGFMILLGGTSDADRLAWNLGGWNNTRHAFQLGGAIVGPTVENLTEAQKIQTCRWYDIRLEREGDRVRGYLDGKLVQEATLPATPDLATIAGRAENGDLLVRVVNGSATARDAQIDVNGFRPESGTATVLTGALNDENSLENPENVAPRTTKLTGVGARFLYRMPAHSLSILRLKG